MVEFNNKTITTRQYLLYTLSAATFIIFFQLYMVAPLIPSLSTFFNATEQKVGLIIPAYLIPYGVSTLFYGLLSDKLGPKKIILTSLFAFAILTALTASAKSTEQLIGWRFITGICASGVVPIALAWISQAYPFEQRGKPLGWLFGAMAGGGAFGSSIGVVIEPFIGWKMLFVGVAVIAIAIWIALYLTYLRVAEKLPKLELSLSKVFRGYQSLLSTGRGKAAYSFVLLNAIFHAGIFTWLALYFKRVYGLNEIEIGLALLGYGIPGFLLGPYIGKLADKRGRSKLLPLGLAISACSALILVLPVHVALAAIAVTILSLGYDLTQPLLAGIITKVGKERPGQAMSLNVFMLFIGFGLGSYLFGAALKLSLTQALVIFTTFQFILSIIALILFKAEKHSTL